MLPRILPRLYRSLCAVKVLLAALRSTLTVLASRMAGLYWFALEEQSLISPTVSSLPNTAIIAQFRGILMVAKGHRGL